MSRSSKRNRPPQAALASHTSRPPEPSGPGDATPSGPLPRPAVLLAIRLLIGVALAVACYLAWNSLTGERPIGCGVGSGCDRVLGNRWAYWLGIPVSVPSVLFYALGFAATFGLHPRWPDWVQARAWQGLVFFAVVLLGAATWFVGLQALVIHGFCRFCLVAHTCGVIASVLVLWSAPIRRQPEGSQPAAEAGYLRPAQVIRWVVAGLGAVGLLAAGQFVRSPQFNVVLSIPKATNGPVNVPLLVSNPRLTRPVPAGTPAPAGASRPFTFYSGRFTLDVQAVPVIGSPTNPQVIVSLFDYTCHHCRVMHPRLVDVQRMFSNQLVVVSLPMPLDPRCNPTVQYTPREHTNACDYARLGLAVWRAARARHLEFEDWLFAADRPPPVPEAEAHAARLVGAEALARARQDPWIEQQLKFNVAVYETAHRAGQGSMPQLIVSTNVAVGDFPPKDLLALLERSLGLKAPD